MAQQCLKQALSTGQSGEDPGCLVLLPVRLQALIEGCEALTGFRQRLIRAGTSQQAHQVPLGVGAHPGHPIGCPLHLLGRPAPQESHRRSGRQSRFPAPQAGLEGLTIGGQSRWQVGGGGLQSPQLGSHILLVAKVRGDQQ